jgi:hypothetical protein
MLIRVAFVFACLFFVVPVIGQTFYGSIVGTVTDASGAHLSRIFCGRPMAGHAPADAQLWFAV